MSQPLEHKSDNLSHSIENEVPATIPTEAYLASIVIPGYKKPKKKHIRHLYQLSNIKNDNALYELKLKAQKSLLPESIHIGINKNKKAGDLNMIYLKLGEIDGKRATIADVLVFNDVVFTHLLIDKNWHLLVLTFIGGADRFLIIDLYSEIKISFAEIEAILDTYI